MCLVHVYVLVYIYSVTHPYHSCYCISGLAHETEVLNAYAPKYPINGHADALSGVLIVVLIYIHIFFVFEL